ncbi:MAG: hypothetical protein H0V44_12180 [Planctomycetes bacterium]|nr:hypothetical protein [Planctomycetota bacterium]
MFMIHFVSADGEEREERWASLESFRSWALTQGTTYRYTAYREDEDGEWEVVEKGRAGQ